MRDDPIVEEVRKARESLAAKFNFDVDAIFADLQKRQAARGARLVSPKNKARSTPKDTSNSDVAVSSSS